MAPVLTMVRVASLGCVALLRLADLDPRLWTAIVLSLGLGHYLLSIVYSQRQIQQAFTQPHSALSLTVMLALGSTLYVTRFPLIIFFGVHHVFNEVYVAYRGAAVRSGMVVNFALYFYLLRGSLPAVERFSAALVAVLALSYAAMAWNLWAARRQIGGKHFADRCVFEAAGVLLAAASYSGLDVGFLEVVLYHFVFWVFFPMCKMTGDRAALVRYAGLTAGATGLFLAVSPVSPLVGEGGGRLFSNQFTLWSYLHITASFALSNANPQWILRWFRPG